MSNQRIVMSFPCAFGFILFFISCTPSCQVYAQSCFYPNGDPSKEDDRPCSSTPGSACCPLNWECLSNGLCFLESAGFYGRYTCTDKTWQSSGCPNICTHSNTASGNEAILQCSGNNYCCDANRPTRGCCDTSNDRIQLQAGSVVASIGNDSPTAAAPVAPSIQPSASSVPPSALQPSFSTFSAFSILTADQSTTSVPVSSSAASTSASVAASSPSVTSNAFQGTPTANSPPATSDVVSSVSPAKSSSATSPSTNQPTTRLIIQTSIATNPSGGSSTLISSLLTTETPASAAPASTASTSSDPTSSPPSSNKNLGAIIGPAVAVPLVVIALATFAFFVWRRHQSKKRAAEAIAAERANYPYTGMAEMNSPASIWVPHSPEQTDRTAGIEVL